MLKSNKESDILYTKWQAEKPKAIFLLVHGLGGHSTRWEFLAQFLLDHNIASYALDLKGFGETKGLKGHIRSFNIYLNDVYALAQIIKQDHPSVPIFLTGESLGGLIAFFLAVKKPQAFTGLICLSPAFKSVLKFSLLSRIKIWASAMINPKKQFSIPFNAQMCTRDSDYQATIENDPLEHRLASANLLIQIQLAQVISKYIAGTLKIPTLFLLSQRDLLVDVKTSQNVFKNLRVEDKTIIQYPNMYHALSIDLEKEKVFNDILKWLTTRLS
ncbi:MAG: lysophospholipase [Candidatus Omnitrophota bacterium]